MGQKRIFTEDKMNNEITREEAIRILNIYRPMWLPVERNEIQHKKAIDVAIKALESQPVRVSEEEIGMIHRECTTFSSSPWYEDVIEKLRSKKLIKEKVKEKKWRVAWRVCKKAFSKDHGQGVTDHMTREELNSWYKANRYEFMQEIDEIEE